MTDSWLQLDCDRPVWLLTMLVIPVLYLVYRRSLADLPGRQMLSSLVTRATIVVLLSLSLSGLTWLFESRQVFVVFGVDRSASVSTDAVTEATEFVEQATLDVSDSRYAIMSFAETC